MYESFLGFMQQGLRSIDLSFDEEQLKKFYIFYEELIRVNEYMNLTAITELEEVVYKHFIDSLYICKFVDAFKDSSIKLRIIDVGTGAGFPGIPLAIAFPHIEFVLIDSLNKRIKFIDDIRDKLDLVNLRAFHSRAEDFVADKSNRESYDFAVSRAVANLSTLSEYCIPFVKIGGAFLPYKSANVSEELESAKSAIKLLGASCKSVYEYTLDREMGDRTLLFIEKIKETPKKYPRKAGMAKSKPL